MRTMYLKALNLKEQHKWEEFLSYMTQIYVGLDEFMNLFQKGWQRLHETTQKKTRK